MSGAIVRAAEEADVPLVLQLIEELAEFEGLRHEVVATAEGLRETLFGEHRYAEVLIVDLDDEAAGFALYFHNYSTFLGRPGLYLEDLYVRPAHRGRGIGRQLIRALAGIALDRGCGRLEWWVLDWNRDAIEFYRSIGAEAMSDWTVFRLSGDALERASRA